MKKTKIQPGTVWREKKTGALRNVIHVSESGKSIEHQSIAPDSLRTRRVTLLATFVRDFAPALLAQ